MNLGRWSLKTQVWMLQYLERGFLFQHSRTNGVNVVNIAKIRYMWRKIWVYVCLPYTLVNEFFREWNHQSSLFPSEHFEKDGNKCPKENWINRNNSVSSWISEDSSWIPFEKYRGYMGRFLRKKFLLGCSKFIWGKSC